MSNSYEIDIEVETSYMAEHSEPDEDRYVFAYTITLVNKGSISATLLSRRWIITDSENHTEEVEGDGVVGAFPVLGPRHRVSIPEWRSPSSEDPSTIRTRRRRRSPSSRLNCS